MFLLLLRCIATVLHAAAMFGLAPLVLGVVAKFRAWLLGQRGPPVLQPYRDLRKLLLKTPLIPDTATELYKIWPFASFAAIAAAALLVPGFALDLLGAGSGDVILLLGLFALSRAATLLAGMETGFGYGGAGAWRAALFGVFTQAALLLAMLVLALTASDPTVDGIAQYLRSGQAGFSVPLLFALAAMLAVAITETGRIVDPPAGQQELGMVYQAMTLEYSGRYLALFQYTAGLRLLVWLCLIGTLFFPFGMAQAKAVFSWPLGLLSWGAKLGVLTMALALLEVTTAKIRVFRVPQFLGAATLLGLLAVIFLFLAQRLGG